MRLAKTQGGIALITAILIAALVTGAAVALATTQQFGIQRTANLLAADRINTALYMLERDAYTVLVEDRKLSRVDSNDEEWAHAELAADYQSVATSGTLVDLQGRMNLSNLARDLSQDRGAGDDADQSDQRALTQQSGSGGDDDATAPAAARQEAASDDENEEEEDEDAELLAFDDNDDPLAVAASARAASNGSDAEDADLDGVAANPEASDSTAPARSATGTSAENIAEQRLRLLLQVLDVDAEPVQAILDWVDSDGETRYPNGAEDDYYMELEPGYRAANRNFASRRELLLVRGITPEIYQKLAPYIVVLPEATKINVNTAPIEILMSIGPGIDRSTAQMLVDSRRVQPFQSVRAFLGHPIMLGRPIRSRDLSVASEFFELRADAHDARLQYNARAVLSRRGGRVATVRRTRGFFDE